MNREETIKTIQDYKEFQDKAKEQGRTVTVFDFVNYMDRPKLNKEVAIDELKEMQSFLNWDDKDYDTLQFAIDYMKYEGEIIGWVNYCVNTDSMSKRYFSKQEAFDDDLYDICIQIPIRKPKI